MQLLNFLHFDYVGAFIVYSLLLIGGTFFFIKGSFSKEEGRWMFFFSIVAFTLSAEGYVRQYLAQPLVFASIPFLLKRKWWPAIVLLAIGANIHTGVMFQPPLLIAFYLLLSKTWNWKVWVGLLFVVYYILPEENW